MISFCRVNLQKYEILKKTFDLTCILIKVFNIYCFKLDNEILFRLIYNIRIVKWVHTWIAFGYVSFEWSEHLSACKQSLLLLGECHSVILPINFLVTLQKKKLITSKTNYITQFIRYEKGSNWTISIIEWKKVLRDEQSTSP